jgi:hypothetical protein
MKTLKFAAYLLYRFYSKNGFAKNLPYLSTTTFLAFLLYIHIFQIFAIFNLTSLIPTDGNELKVANWLKMAMFMLPMFLIIIFLIKKEDLVNAHYDEKKVKRGYVYLIAYVIISFAFLMFLALVKKGKI